MEDANDSLDPDAALRMVRQSHAVAAMRAKAPWWYYPVIGFMFGLQIVSIGRPDAFLSIVGLFGAFAAMWQYERLTGVRLNAFVSGSLRSRLAMAGGMTVVVLFVVTALWLKRQTGMQSAIIGVAVGVALFIAVFGPLWERLFRHDEALRA